jgi:hypothetical protein
LERACWGGWGEEFEDRRARRWRCGSTWGGSGRRACAHPARSDASWRESPECQMLLLFLPFGRGYTTKKRLSSPHSWPPFLVPLRVEQALPRDAHSRSLRHPCPAAASAAVARETTCRRKKGKFGLAHRFPFSWFVPKKSLMHSTQKRTAKCCYCFIYIGQQRRYALLTPSPQVSYLALSLLPLPTAKTTPPAHAYKGLPEITFLQLP